MAQTVKICIGFNFRIRELQRTLGLPVTFRLLRGIGQFYKLLPVERASRDYLIRVVVAVNECSLSKGAAVTVKHSEVHFYIRVGKEINSVMMAAKAKRNGYIIYPIEVGPVVYPNVCTAYPIVAIQGNL